MLSRIVPGFMVRWFARPYVAGESLAAALDLAAARHAAGGLLATLDLLGEDVNEPAQVEANVAAYERMIEALSTDARFADPATRPTISLKPSAFTTSKREAACDPIRRIAARAQRAGVPLTVDMEDRRWTDLTIDLVLELIARGDNVGTVLQTRLHRTEADLERFDAGMRVRLVIGIYPEPKEAAISDKREMKERLLRYAKRLLERGVFVEFATHDVEILERFAREVAPAAPDRCEAQMLLGVPRAKLQARLREGALGVSLPVRLYIPFALGWDQATAYLRRRMAESPSTMWLVLRNLLKRGS